jgi:hypothetical protein
MREAQSRRRGERRCGSPERLRYEALLRFLLKKSIVRCQASFAAASSNLGVVSLLKPCCVPG